MDALTIAVAAVRAAAWLNVIDPGYDHDVAIDWRLWRGEDEPDCRAIPVRASYWTSPSTEARREANRVAGEAATTYLKAAR